MRSRVTRTRTKRGRVRIKRAFEPPADTDGPRVLVDRLWPRGIRKQALAPHEWARELSPSDGLRRWFGHEPSSWREFRRRYRRELASAPAREALGRLVALARRGRLTLVYAASDEEHNNAVVLAAMIAERLSRSRPKASAAPASTVRAPSRSARAPRAKARPRGR